MPPKSMLDFFSGGAGRRLQTDPAPAPSTHLASSQLPLRERILQQGNKSLFFDDMRRAMAIAFDSSSGIVVETMEFRLMCSYSQTRMVIPVRSDSCHHLQCCDLDSWASLFAKFKTMRDPAAPCPVCNQRILLSTLREDEWMKVVLRNLPATKLVVLNRDGTYQSGDSQRVAKRQRDAEEIIVTQCSVERDDDTLDEDDTRVDVKQEGAFVHEAQEAPNWHNNLLLPSSSLAAAPLVKLEPGLSSVHGPQLVQVKDNDPATVGNAQLYNTALSDTSSMASVVELQSAGTMRGAQLSYAVSSSQPRRIVPANWRRWSPYCPRCSVHCLLEHANDGVQYDGDDAVFECPRCRSTRPRCAWPSLRKFKRRASMQWQRATSDFGEAQSTTGEGEGISLEVTEDETVLVAGHPRAVGLLGHYLLRGGFYLHTDDACSWSSSSSSHETAVVWYSSQLLSKPDIDFLETVCDAVAQEEDPIEYNGVAPFRFKFRYEKRLQSSQQFGGGQSYSQGTTLTQQQAASTTAWSPPPAPSSPASPAGGVAVAGSRSGSFRIR